VDVGAHGPTHSGLVEDLVSAVHLSTTRGSQGGALATHSHTQHAHWLEWNAAG